MKHILKSTLLMLGLCAFVTTASAQHTPARPAATPATPTPAAPAAAEADKKSDALQIVFVPKAMMEKNLPSGKLKENTLYWFNFSDNAEHAPVAKQEEGKTFLRVQGKYEEKNGKIDRMTSRTEIFRAFNVPEGAKTAKVQSVVKAIHDVWSDDAPGTPQIFAGGHATREGKKLSSTIEFPKVNAGWQTLGGTIVIHPGTQQIVISYTTDGGVPLDIQSMSVTFE
jgi:hypothetical protein